MRTFATFLLFFSFISIGWSQDSTFSIIEHDTSAFYVWDFKNHLPSTINEKEMEQLVKILNQSIQDNQNGLTNERNQIGNRVYYKQLVPMISPNGDKEVFVNCLCSESNPNIDDKELIVVFDGGNCFWNVTINLTKSTYHRLYVNGF